MSARTPSRISPDFWFVPTWSGDFRIERQAESQTESTLLTVEDPTPGDRERLKPFLRECATKGWCADGIYEMIKATGETRVKIEAPTSQTGPLLARMTLAAVDVWTGVRFKDGQIAVVDGIPGASVPADTKVETLDPAQILINPDAAEPTKQEQPAPAPEPKPEPVAAAATVRAPNRGCPAPTACERRSSEVLRTFCTKEQWARWQNDGKMRVIGNSTGRAYWLYHRDEAASRGLPRVLIEAATGTPICVWDDRVPAAEEALALKFSVEHREKWMLSLKMSTALDIDADPLRARRGGRARYSRRR